MSKTYLLVICLLFASFTGCMEDEEEETLERHVRARGTASYENGTSSSAVMQYIIIEAYEDSMETYLNCLLYTSPSPRDRG